MNLISQDALDVERWRRIESVLDPALDLEPHQVAAYLDRACAGSPELRAEVEALLEADRRAKGFLSVPAVVLVNPFSLSTHGGPALDSVEERPEPEPPPHRLGRYRVMGELGRGGMGIVYRGRDDELDREVAIKGLPARMASDPARLARFLVEARLLAALHDPHIAGIHGVEQADGRRYLILERVEGTTLSERLRADRLPLDQALDCGAQVAEALAAAHALGIVHRDLKPGNIMRTPAGLVKVLDFGLAMQVSRRAARPDRPLAPSAASADRLGTPGFMSPEQILGLPQDARTDLFALGAVLYQCLTGARAFPGSSVFAVIDATLNATVDAARLPTETPEPVRAVLARMLEKEPAARPAGAGEIASILRSAVAGAGARTPRARIGGLRAPRLPRPVTPLVGRERDIEAALRLLERAGLVTLTGAAGCGKTRLAIEIARAAHESLADETWFVDLAPAADSAALAAAVAATADLRDPSERGLEDALIARLGERTGLLVLDNCDRIPGPCAALASRLLARRSHLRILATSREWLGVSGEQTLRVAPLSVPDAERPPGREAALAAESVRMFVACASASPGGFALTDSNAGVVTGICRDLDGVPLAIELTAALLRQQSLDEVARDLRGRLGLAESAEASGSRLDPLRAAMQLGYDRLDADERRFLRALSVFTGGFGLESAAGVCGADPFATLDRLTRLMDKSLVAIQHVDRMEPRYRLLESIRQFAAVRCEEEHEAEALRARHLAWFLATAERAAPALLSGSDQAQCLASLEADHPNLLAALDECASVENGASKALRLAGSVWHFWYVRGHFARGRAALERALALPGAEAPTHARAQALFAASGLALFQGDFAAGRRLSRQALESYQSLDDRLGVARSLSHLALCESGEARYPEARALTEQAVEIFRVAGDARRLSATLNNLGMLKRQRGDYASSLPDFEEALELRRRADDRDGMIVTLVNLGLTLARLGREPRAGLNLDEALALVQDLRAKRSGAAALEVAAEILAGRERLEDAARLFGAARALRSTMALESDEWWRGMKAALEDRLRAALAVARFDRVASEGAALDFERAVDLARLALQAGNAVAQVPSSTGDNS